ncbi:MAG: UrcA family protein [Phenylobacterium sp.]|uniref:UrcA family protein n=1 Tax=Phenylobacterium sp. TaxID=1871053 RepID=UPI0025E4A908|nr:UrcA family protein [Phenylobacterium sp.]MBI1198489.1 UrcA family protein [Phenylobacterium sp.]
MNPLMTTALAALALSAPAAAMATPSPTASRSVAVATDDLNARDPLAASVLSGRIDAAAAQVCGADRTSVTDVQRAARRSACYERAVENALAQLDPATADAVSRARTPRVPPP